MTREAAGWKAPWIREEELSFLETLGKRLPIGGEAVSPESAGLSEGWGCAGEKVMAELRTLRLTYLNRAYDRKLLDRWEKEGLLDVVGVHLGYRFVLRKAELIKSFGSQRRLCLEIENSGFGGLFQEAELFLLLKSGEKTEELPIETDFGTWAERRSGELEVRLEPEIAELYLKLRRKKTERADPFRE